MANTVGSLTKDQKSILIGCLLGDGTMRKKINAYLEVNHAYSQKVLVDWLYKQFKAYVLTAPKKRKGNGKREAYRFFTRSLPDLTPFYDFSYKKGKKIIPNNLRISALSLAIWFMDDGNKSRSSVYLNTQQFSKTEQLELICLLKKQLGIEATLNRDKSYYRIRIRTGSVKRLVKLVENFVLPEFRYKLPFVMTL
jgi:intein/homing endonuclease